SPHGDRERLGGQGVCGRSRPDRHGLPADLELLLMTQTLVTRRVLARELALHAATRPLNIIAPAGVVIAAILLTFWLLPVAVVVYAALVVTTLLDGDVAESVGREVYARARGTLPRAELSNLTP